MKTFEEWRYSSAILNLCIGGKWSASRPSRSCETAPGTHRRLDGCQSWSGCYEEEKSVMPLPGVEAQETLYLYPSVRLHVFQVQKR
jgi:hypothetical protein